MTTKTFRTALTAPLIGPVTGLALVAALAGCSGSTSTGAPAAAPVTTTASTNASTTPSATTTTSTPNATATPTLTPPTADPAAVQALPALVAREHAQTSALAPGFGQDSPDLAVLASTTGEISTTITFWAWNGSAWTRSGSLKADEPLLVQRQGGASEWHYLTGGHYPDAVVYVEGGTLSGKVDAVIARHEEDGTWRFVPLDGQNDGIDPSADVYAHNPLFDESMTFVTRVQDSGQVYATYWKYDATPSSNRFEQSPGPSPTH